MGWPKYLKKTYTKEELTGKVLKKVQLKHDKEFLESLFLSEKRGVWSLKKNLTKAEKTRLKKIVKEIKKGKGGVKVIPLLILLILVGGLTFFTLFLKNPLVEKILENSLESLFGATVEIDNLKVSLVNTQLELNRLVITDEADLKRNLVDLGTTRINFNGRALLQRKFVIETLECRQISWDTLRKTPGTLVKNEKRNDDSTKGSYKEENLLSFTGEQKGSTFNTVFQAAQDPETFVNDYWTSFKTPAAVQETAKNYESLLSEQQNRIDDIKRSGEVITEKGASLLSRDFSEYKDNPLEIPQLVKEADEYKNDVVSATALIGDELARIEEIRQSLQEDKDRLLRLKEEDYAQLRTLVSLPGAEGFEGVFKGIVQSYIASLLGDKYGKVMNFLEYIKEYRRLAGDRENESKESRGSRSGRVVSFDSTLWPAFLIEQGVFSSRAENLLWEVEAHDISGIPEQWDTPITVDLVFQKEEGTLEGEGIIDLRDKRNSYSEGQIDFEGLPLTSSAMASLGISQLSGNAGGTAHISVDNSAWMVDTDLILSGVELKKEQGDQISDIIYTVLSRDDWEMGVLLKGEGDKVVLDLDWPLLSLIDEEVGSLIKEQADKLLSLAEEELAQRFTSELSVIEGYSVDLDSYRDILKGDLSSLNKQERDITRKVEEIKAQAASQASDKSKDTLESVSNTIKNLF